MNDRITPTFKYIWVFLRACLLIASCDRNQAGRYAQTKRLAEAEHEETYTRQLMFKTLATKLQRAWTTANDPTAGSERIAQSKKGVELMIMRLQLMSEAESYIDTLNLASISDAAIEKMSSQSEDAQ